MDNQAKPPASSMWALRRENDLQRYALWDALADFGPHAMDDALQFCMRQIGGWIDTQSAFWVATVRVESGGAAARDHTIGWRLGAVAMLNSPETAHVFSHANTGCTDIGMTTRTVLAQAGHFRVYALSKDMLDLDAFQQTEHYDAFYRQPGVVDRIWVVFPVNEDTESCFCFDRLAGQREFDGREVKTAGEALRGIKWFHRQLFLGRGLGVADKPLAPAERKVVHELLTGASEKVIAQRLQLTPATIHQYITRVYRKFGVKGRAEFMSLWLDNTRF